MTVRLPLYYQTEVSWTKDRMGKVTSFDVPVIAVAPPPEFGGPEAVWSPEQLFVASINSCFMATFLTFAERSNLVFRSFTCAATGKLDTGEDRSLQITNITLNPKLVIAADSDLDLANRLLAKAKAQCLISNSVKSTVKLDAEVMYE